MQGKDIPTRFKRVRQASDAEEDPFQVPAASGSAQFIPMHTGLYIINTPLYPHVASLPPPGYPALPANEPAANISAAGASAASIGRGDADMGSGRSRGHSQPLQNPREDHGKRFSQAVGDSLGDSDDADDEDGTNGDEEGVAASRTDKGKGRMGDGPGDGPGRRTQSGQQQFSVSYDFAVVPTPLSSRACHRRTRPSPKYPTSVTTFMR